MKKKLIASMAVVAAVAGVGVLAAGCGGDEFKKAPVLKLADYEKEYNQYVTANTEKDLDSYDFSIESNMDFSNVEDADAWGYTRYYGTVLKVVTGTEGQEKTTYNMKFKVEADMYLSVNLHYTINSDVTIIDQDVYYTNSNFKVKTTLTALQAGAGQSDVPTAEELIWEAVQGASMYVQYLGAPEVEVAAKEEDNTYVIKQIKQDEKNRKYLVQNKEEELDKDGYGNVTEETYRLVYQDNKLAEYSEEKVVNVKEKDGSSKWITKNSFKKTSVTEIKAPANAKDYKDAAAE